jgi:hypothetical protein
VLAVQCIGVQNLPNAIYRKNWPFEMKFEMISALHCTELQCTVLHCTALHCAAGDSGVGKSSLLVRFADNHFSGNYITTIGVRWPALRYFVLQ